VALILTTINPKRTLIFINSVWNNSKPNEVHPIRVDFREATVSRTYLNMTNHRIMNQYFSKYRNPWVEFKTPPTPGQIAQLKKFQYRLILDGIEQ